MKRQYGGAGKVKALLITNYSDPNVKGWVLGDNRFRAKIEQLSGGRSAAKPRGRPKKSKD